MSLFRLFVMATWIAAVAAPDSATAASGSPSARVVLPFNSDWAFQYFPHSNPPEAVTAVDYDDSSWPAIATPHTWSTFETTRDVHPFIMEASERRDPYWWRGWGVYRKSFEVTPDRPGRRWFIEFEGAQKHARVYLNGHFLGEHKGGYTAFSYDLTDFLYLDGQTANVLAVLVSNRRDDLAGGIPPMTAGNFNVYGGLYREVRLVGTAGIFFPFQGSAEHEGGLAWSTPLVSPERATARLDGWLQNSLAADVVAEITAVVHDPDGAVVATLQTPARLRAGEINQVVLPLLSLPQPRLWSPDSPAVYRIVASVSVDGEVLDQFTAPLGFRSYRWDHATNRLFWNGEPLRINGTNRHQEYPWVGDAMPDWMHRRDHEDMRFALGHNFTRTAHYPQDPYVYDLTDSLGFVTVAEVPNIKSLPFGRDIQRDHVREMVRRLRNHPSIFMWSVGNETDRAADSAWVAELDASRLIHTRKTEAHGDHVDHDHTDLDMESLLRVTVRGWSTSEVKDLQPENSELLPKSGQEAGTEAWQHQQARVRDASIRGLISDDGVAWLYADHGADRNYRNSPLQNVNAKGWVDLFRFPKYMYYLWQANWTERPMIFVRPFYWQSTYVGQAHPIQVDANAEEVELLVNGRSLGRHPLGPEVFFTTEFADVPIETGVLTGIAFRDGREVARQQVVMPGPAAAVHLEVRHGDLPADRSGLAEVVATVVDADGVRVPGARPDLSWEVEGPAALVGPAFWTHDSDRNLEVSGPWYIDTPVANLVRTGDTPGAITVRVHAAGLASGTVAFASTPAAPLSFPAIAVVPLDSAGRTPVARAVGFRPSLSRITVLNRRSGDNVRFPRDANDSWTATLLPWVLAEHTEVDPTDPVLAGLLLRLEGHLHRTGGELIMDDYNVEAEDYNDQRSLERLITDLPFHPDYRQAWIEHLRSDYYLAGLPLDLDHWDTFFRDIPTEGRFVLAVLNAQTRKLDDEYRRTEYFHRVRAASVEQIIAHFEPSWHDLDADARAARWAYLQMINPVLRETIELAGRTSPLRLRFWIPDFSLLP